VHLFLLACSQLTSSHSIRRFYFVAFLYALGSVILELAGVPHDRLILLVAQYAILMPVAVAAVRHAPDGTARDIDRRLLITVGIVTAAVVVAIAKYWDRGMLWGDETAYRLQAQIFASGHPWIDAPVPTSTDPALSARELHFNHLIIHDGHWFTKYPPLWPLVLAVGHALHVRWLVNPVLAVVALWIIDRIARCELALPTPRLAVLIVIASPFFYMMAASEMSHMLGLVCCAGAALGVLQGVRTQRVAGLVAAIVLVGVCCFVRPFTAFCAAVALVPCLLAPEARRMLPRLAAIGLVLGAAVVAGLALYNQLYTGHYGRSPYALYRGTELPVELSASPRVILGNLMRGVRWAVEDTLIFVWPLIAALAGYGWWRARGLPTRLLASFCLVFVVSNVFHTEGSSSRFGDRYLFEAMFAPALLAAQGAALLIKRWRLGVRAFNRVATVLTVVCVIQGAAMIRGTLLEIRRYVQVHDAVDALPPDGSLVFFPITDDFTGDRDNLNGPDWRTASHLFLVDPGPARRAAVAMAEGRPRWIVLGYQDGQPTVLAEAGAP
jgi:hypothetical protein